jgi:hypothetical protein
MGPGGARRSGEQATTNRRSLLISTALGVGALMPRRARAHSAALAPVSSPAGSSAAAFPDLKKLGAEHQLRTIRHRNGFYRVVTADGRSVDFLEPDLRFKVDSSAIGPEAGRPVILTSGEVGDRASVFFASPGEIASFVEQRI